MYTFDRASVSMSSKPGLRSSELSNRVTAFRDGLQTGATPVVARKSWDPRPNGRCLVCEGDCFLRAVRRHWASI